MTTTNPIRVIGVWEQMSADERAAFINRGRDKIFDPALQESIRSLIEQVRLEGDAAVVRALKEFDGVDLGTRGLQVTDEEYEAARASVSPELLEAIRDDPRMGDDIMDSADYLRVELHFQAGTEMITTLDDFMRRRSKIDLVVAEADVRSSAGLQEVATILFGDDADRRLHEYYRHRGWES